MRTNGFIFIALGLTAAALAGRPDYLPNVGPVGLRFAPAAKPIVAVPLPPLPSPQPAPEIPQSTTPVAEIVPTEPVGPPTASALMQNPPVALPEPAVNPPTNVVGPLIGPQMDTNGTVTPQMFLRFFAPNQNGQSREAVIAAPPGFSPARPPAASSTATYTKTK